MFEGWVANYRIVTHGEIIKAAIIGDVALIMITIASIRASIVEYKNNKRISVLINKARTSVVFRTALLAMLKVSIAEHGRKKRYWLPNHNQTELSLKHIWRVVGVTLPIGFVGMILFISIPGITNSNVDLGTWQSSSWLFITPTWVGLAFLALIYWYGFRWWLVLPISLYLMIIGLQGYHRFRLIIPLILMIQIYLDRHRLAWPRPRIFVLLFIMMLIFYPLKSIGSMVQQGASITEVASLSTTNARDVLSGQHGDQQFLDMFAASLTLMDEKNVTYYGRTYLALVTLPIPRQWWPRKPALNDFIKDFSTPSRPMGEMGMIVTFLGEAYGNFGYIGVLLVPYLMAYWLARAYFYAYRKNYLSITRFIYLLIACNLIQVYRDGLVSIVVFTCVNMMPLMLIVLLHYIFPLKRESLREPHKQMLLAEFNRVKG